MAPTIPEASSRRRILAASAALAGAAALSSCGGSSKTKSTETVNPGQMQNDAAVIANLLDLERSAVVAYAAIAAKLSGPGRALAIEFRGHEQAHASRLAAAIGMLGQAPPASKPPAEYRASFPPLRSARDAFSFALDVETTAISAYADALGKLVTDPLRATLASVMATEAEHAAVLLGKLGRPQVPAAFVTGPPPDQGSG